MLTAHGATHPGKVRTLNEDVFHCDPAGGLLAVADGMGGHKAGEVASSLAIETVHTFVRLTREDDKFTWPFGFDSRLSYAANCLVTAMRLANRRVFKAADSRDEYTGMGTTLTVVLVSGDTLTWASVGDSRLYLLRGGRLERLTTDDSWVARLQAEVPAVDRSSIAAHPMRNVLTKVVGAAADLEVTAAERPLAVGDLLLLCSDGLHGLVPDEAIAPLLAAGTVEQAAAQLIQRALERGGSDNVTVVLGRYGQAGAAP
jgi:PPM family protein phosphatase